MNISWPDGLGSSLRCCLAVDTIHTIILNALILLFSLKCQCEVIWGSFDVSWKRKLRNRTGRGCVIVLPITADTYVDLIHASDIKDSGSHAVKVEGVSSATLTVWAPGGLFFRLRCGSDEQYLADRQGSPSPAPCWAAAVETPVSSVVMYHNKCLRPSITWPSGFYLALSSLSSTSFLSISYFTSQTGAAEELETQPDCTLHLNKVESMGRVWNYWLN